MANSIRNSHQRSVLHIDTTDGAITLAELTATGESTPTKAHIVDIYWQTAGSLTIDRGGTNVHAFTGTGHWNLMQSGCELGVLKPQTLDSQFQVTPMQLLLCINLTNLYNRGII